jgi:uncharacterized coiled-coil protein SlyX
MVGRGLVTAGAPERPPLAVLEARAAEQAYARIRELEATVEAQSAELAKLCAQLIAERARAAAPKKKRKANGERKP